MARYDTSFGPGGPAGRPRARYGNEYRAYGTGRPGYARGTYGRDFPFYAERGPGRPPPGYDRGWRGPAFTGERYGGDFARAPFMPERAYLRHPEYDRPPTYHQYQHGWEAPLGRYVLPGEEEMGDDEIRQEVRQRLYHDSWLDADRIEVEVQDGVVTLTGEVDDFLEARYAWDDAWETDGVRGVVNHLTVRPEPDDEHGDVLPQTAG